MFRQSKPVVGERPLNFILLFNLMSQLHMEGEVLMVIIQISFLKWPRKGGV